MQVKNSKTFFRSIIIKMLISILVVYIGTIVFMCIYQDNMIFEPSQISEQALEEIRQNYENTEDITLESSDGVKIRGWLVKSEKYKKAPLVIYYGGQGDELSEMIQEASKLNGWSLALMNYRGYGLSEGHPSEEVLFKDALAAYDYFSKREDIDAQRIVVMGRSLGTGVAVYVAANKPVEGVILATPYDSVMNVAQEEYFYLPVSLLLKHKFDSIQRAPSIKVPMLELVASEDETIPPVHAERLAEKWGGGVDVKLIDGQDHESIVHQDVYWKDIDEFLAKM